MNRNENEAESFAGNFMAFGEEALFFEVPLNMSSGGTLNEARANVGVALSNLIHSQPTQEKIDKAKSAIQAWIQELEAAKL